MELRTSLSNDTDAYLAFAQEVAAFHERAAMPAHMAYAADMALEELLTNIIKYGYDAGGEHRIDVLLRLDGAGLFIRVEDDGHPFDPTAAPEPDITLPVQERPIGGVGLLLVRRNFPHFLWRRENGKNITELAMPAAAV